jgi:thiol-disulfide isomerase/thioredoxin
MRNGAAMEGYRIIKLMKKKLRLTSLLSLCLITALRVQGAVNGDSAPQWTLPQLLEETVSVSLSDHAGKIIYLDFWASWCPPCLVSMPIMNEMRNRLQADGVDFEVIAINVDSDPRDGIEFLLDNPVDFIVLSDPNGNSPAEYSLKGMPTSYLINQQGNIVMVHEGFKRSDAHKIENQIISLVDSQ